MKALDLKTAIAFREEFLWHDTGIGHPETSGRLDAILNHLQQLDGSKFQWEREFRTATLDEISLIHTPDYVRTVEATCKSKLHGYFDGDTPFSKDSYDAAALASGAGIFLADQILGNKIKNGFALVRPPGHHAEASFAMGFCLFNNIAITAKYLLSRGIKRVLILDWDVHHGNGTQHQFYEDDSVFFISFHQYPFYPGTGAKEEEGKGKGIGFTLNLPLPKNSGESDYLNLWPLIQSRMEKFQPEFILISAGFDAHRDDPLGGMLLSTSSFAAFTEKILQEANLYAQGRIISFLEGGYNFNALADSVKAHLEVLAK